MRQKPTIARNAALVLIDLQRAVDHPSWGVRNNQQAEDNVAHLLAAWRTSSRPVVHVRHESREPQSTFRPGQVGIEFKEVSVPLPGELVVTKHRPSALIGTSLEAWLRSNRIPQLVIVGVSTSNSVEATARVAGDLGFDTIVVADATFTFARSDFDGRARTAEEVHAMSLANLSGEYATIYTTAQVLTTVGSA